MWLDTRNICSERLCDMELQQGLRGYRTAAVANSIGQRSIVKLPICGSQIRRILRTQITVTSRCSGSLRSRTLQRPNGINGGDPRSGEEAVYAGFAYP